LLESTNKIVLTFLLPSYSWFSGVWKVASICTEVLAPCGIGFFGGNQTYQSARMEVNNPLYYESRFISPSFENQRILGINSNDGLGTNVNSVIADREFNVKSLARVAMGENSVVDVSLASPNKFSCLLSLEGAPSLLTVDLLVLNRRQEYVNKTSFHCSEVVREIVAGVERRKPAFLKEIETISLYTLGDNGNLHCRQRSATFLLPSQQDAIAFQMWQASQGKPVDVRFYDVMYEKVQ
jgi:hypothetical protein